MSRDDITRRNFLLKLSAVTGLTVGAGTLLTACGGGESGQASSPAADAPAAADAGTATGCNDLSGLSDPEVQLRGSLQYVDESTTTGRTCDNCALYVAAESGSACGTCTLIKGPIAAKGYCASWAPQPA